MNINATYTSSGYIISIPKLSTCRLILLICVLGIGLSSRTFANDDLSVPDYDETSVFFQVPRVGGQEVSALIKNQEVYLSIIDVFNFLKLKNSPSPDLDSISGFFLATETQYLIDKENNRIVLKGNEIKLPPGELIKTESGLYLKSNYFGDIFGLVCTFNFRGLAVTLNTVHELPVVKEMKMELMRKNISLLKREVKADTTIGRSYSLFKVGMADWSVYNTQQEKQAPFTRVNLNLGGTVAGGETNVNLNYFNNESFTLRQQQYLWRFADNNQPFLRQVLAGKISTFATSSLVAPIVGLQLTNTPTTYRRSFGTYRISNTTEPGWTVELYVNNILIDYVKADASGFYQFDVPLVYGNTAITLRFYGPWGEERSSERNISVPFNFLPEKEFEYLVSAGVVEDTLSSKFSRGAFNYGVTKNITAGGGVEYLSSVGSAVMPFVNTSVKIYKNLLFSGDHTYKVRSRGILTYRTKSDLQLELNYSYYDRNQKAINLNYLEERKLIVSFPIQTKHVSAFSRFTLNEILVPGYKFTTAHLLLSGVYAGVSTNVSTYAILTHQAKNTNVYSSLAQTYRLPKNILFTPQIQYNFSRQSIASTRAELEKRFSSKAVFNIFYDKNFFAHTQYAGIGLRYDFSFVRTGFNIRQGRNYSNATQQANGSLTYDRKSKYFGFNNRNSIGRGGISIQPFMDFNANGKRDKNEPKALGLRILTKGGRVVNNTRDTTIQILDLEPYTRYLIEIDKGSFENIAWQIKNNTISVSIDPNQLKLVEVPVTIAGEVSGIVQLSKNKEKKGQGQIAVNIYRNGSLVAQTLTESDGYFSYMGLPQGAYSVQIDPIQLKNLNMRSNPEALPINIIQKTEGDIADGLTFELTKAP